MSPLLLLIGAAFVMASDDSKPTAPKGPAGLTGVGTTGQTVGTIPGTTAPAPPRAPTPITTLHIGSDQQFIQPQGLYRLKVNVATLGQPRGFLAKANLQVRHAHGALYACTRVWMAGHWDADELETAGAGGGACPDVTIWEDGVAKTRVSGSFVKGIERQGLAACFVLAGQNDTGLPLMFTLAVQHTINQPFADWPPS